MTIDHAFCDANVWHVRIGGLVVYTDDNHVTRSFALSLVPQLRAELIPLLQHG